MRIVGIVAQELEVRSVTRKSDGSTAQVRTIRVLDDSTGDVIEVTSWKPDDRLEGARKGETIELDAKSWDEYNGRLRVEVAPPILTPA